MSAGPAGHSIPAAAQGVRRHTQEPLSQARNRSGETCVLNPQIRGILTPDPERSGTPGQVTGDQQGLGQHLLRS